MYDITILSIFRDSMNYLERYMYQVSGVIPMVDRAHFIWLEGDSSDATVETLKRYQQEMPCDVTLAHYNHGGPYWPSIQHPDRWKQLSDCWNQALKYLVPSKYCICVESDLRWEASLVASLVNQLNALSCDVIYPMNMMPTRHFYDTWAFRSGGKRWTSHPPFTPNWNGERFVEVDMAGGMIVTTYDQLKTAYWAEDSCILQFPNATKKIVDRSVWVVHP